MNDNQKKGIAFIVGGVLSIIIIPRILLIVGLYEIAYYLEKYYVIYLVALILIGLGIKLLISKNTDSEKEEAMNYTPTDIYQNVNQNIRYSPNTNKVVNVVLTGGIIGLIGDSPQKALNRHIKRENLNGWKVIQVIPSASGNILLLILRFMLLIFTFFFYTTTNGYYVIMERKEDQTPSKKKATSNDGIKNDAKNLAQLEFELNNPNLNPERKMELGHKFDQLRNEFKTKYKDNFQEFNKAYSEALENRKLT